MFVSSSGWRRECLKTFLRLAPPESLEKSGFIFSQINLRLRVAVARRLGARGGGVGRGRPCVARGALHVRRPGRAERAAAGLGRTAAHRGGGRGRRVPIGPTRLAG